MNHVMMLDDLEYYFKEHSYQIGVPSLDLEVTKSVLLSAHCVRKVSHCSFCYSGAFACFFVSVSVSLWVFHIRLYVHVFAGLPARSFNCTYLCLYVCLLSMLFNKSLPCSTSLLFTQVSDIAMYTNTCEFQNCKQLHPSCRGVDRHK